jgi:hypothetical protein
MSLMIPGALADLLNELGYFWPKTQEVEVFDLGQDWLAFGGDVQGLTAQLTPHADRVGTDNQSEAIEAFKTLWAAEDSGPTIAGDGGTGSMVTGACLFVAAALVLVLKITVIVQLIILVVQIIQAIAAAAVTFGGSLLSIPVFKKLTGMAIDLLVGRVVAVLA